MCQAVAGYSEIKSKCHRARHKNQNSKTKTVIIKSYWQLTLVNSELTSGSVLTRRLLSVRNPHLNDVQAIHLKLNTSRLHVFKEALVIYNRITTFDSFILINTGSSGRAEVTEMISVTSALIYQTITRSS